MEDWPELTPLTSFSDGHHCCQCIEMNWDYRRSPWIGLEMCLWGVMRKLEVVGQPCILRCTLQVWSVWDLRQGIITYSEPYPSYLALPLHLCSFLPILLTSNTYSSIPDMLHILILESWCTSNLASHTLHMVSCAWCQLDPLYASTLWSLSLYLCLCLCLCLQLHDISAVDHLVSTHPSL